MTQGFSGFLLCVSVCADCGEGVCQVLVLGSDESDFCLQIKSKYLTR